MQVFLFGKNRLLSYPMTLEQIQFLHGDLLLQDAKRLLPKIRERRESVHADIYEISDKVKNPTDLLFSLCNYFNTLMRILEIGYFNMF